MNQSATNRHIISVSRRTDIPAFYTDWFLNRLCAGYVLVRNPFNTKQVRKVSLIPNDVSVIVFWTRDFSPMLPHIVRLDDNGYRYAILWTITGYPKSLEPNCLPLDKAIDAFCKISTRIGMEKMAWRYDPIIITDELTPEWHIENFARIAEHLGGYTNRIIVSLMTPYRSVLRRFDSTGIHFTESPLERDDVCKMLAKIPQVAQQHGIEQIQACCQSGALAQFGIPDGACIDTQWLSDALAIELPAAKDNGQRKNCLCTKSIDIGAYDTCRGACAYCYAVKNPVKAMRFASRYNPHAEMLG